MYNSRCVWLLVMIIFLQFCTQKPVVSPPQTESIPNPFDQTAQKLAQESQFKSSNFYFKKAMEIYKTSGHWDKVIRCHIHMGSNFQEMGDHQKAMEYFDKSLNLVLKHSGYEYADLANQYKKLAFIYFSKKEYNQSLRLYQKALTLQLQVFNENHLQIAKSFNSIALVYWNMGNTQKATEFYNKSLSIKLRGFSYLQLDFAKKYAFIDGGITKFSSFRQIKDYFKKSLQIYRETYGGIHPLMASLYEKIGILYGFEGSFDRAMHYFRKSLNIRIESFGDESPATASSYHNIGICLRLKKDYLEAIRFLELSLQIKKNSYGESHPSTADSYYQLGKVHFYLNQFDRSLHFYQRSLIAMVPQFSDTRIHSNPTLKNIYVKSELLKVLADKAEALRMNYQFNPQKIDLLKLSVDTYHLIANLIDEIRREFRSEDYKLLFGEQSHDIYESAIQAAGSLYEMSGESRYKAEAFRFSEKSKAALLYESIIESKAKKFSGIPKELLDKERGLKKELAYFCTYLEKYYQNRLIEKKQNLDELEYQYFEKKNECQQLITFFEKKYPKYYNLKYQYDPVSIPELQKQLDHNTVMVEYFVGRDMITTFVLTRNKFHMAHHYAGSEIQQVVNSYYRSIKKIEEKTFVYLSQRLYRILIEPIYDWIKDKPKLIIIPHGYLYYIPFESLVSGKSREGDFLNIDYLIRHHAISYHYSASLWESRDLKYPEQREKCFIGFAPVFSEKEKKGYVVSSDQFKPEHLDYLSNFRAYGFGGKQFPQLLASERELLSIIDLFRRYDKKAVGYFHQQAKESHFKSTGVKDYRFIHIATHSLNDKKNPKLSGLLFSPEKEPSDREDGILFSEETFNLDLNAELMVLSSCESGIGKLVKGEGMIALNRGFFYSGAKNIIFSLWKVEDKATCRLMIELYRNILKNMPLPVALQKAKLTLIRDRFTAFPKYWSSFILIGE